MALDASQANYLFSVMRLGQGDDILVFNGRDGEWRARITEAGRRGGRADCVAQTRPQNRGADLWLMFAPLKKTRTDFIVEKAVELGAARLLPVQTDFTSAERLRADKAAAHVREAAEQCDSLTLPEVAPLQTLTRVLAAWDGHRRILWADEGAAGSGGRTRAGLARIQPGPWAVLVGPEGGFSPGERKMLSALPFVTPLPLGPRILRAETAAVALLALWQAQAGDW